jgi:hypothetical protein
MAKMTSTECSYALSLGEPATYDAAGCAAKTFTPVPDVFSIGAYGPSYSEVEAMPLATGIVETEKGFGRSGAIDVEMYLNSTDAGQILISSGVSGINRFTRFTHRITYQDGSVDYSVGKLFTADKNIGAADNIVSRTVRVVFDKFPIEVAAP